MIGGALTITGQRLTDRHRDDAERQAAARQVARDAADRDRAAVLALHQQVSVDVAEIRAEISATDDEVKAVRADRLAPLIHDVRARSDRAAALIAVAPDAAVRQAADNVYDCFGLWLDEEVRSLTNGTSAPDPTEVRASPSKLATAVRDFLLQLQVLEESAVAIKR